MRSLLLASVALLAILTGCSGGSVQHAGSLSNTPAAGRYIVGLNPGAPAANSLAAGHAIVPEHVYSRVLNGFSATLTAGQVQALQANPGVRFVEHDLIATTTPPGGGGGNGGGGGGGGGQQLPWGVNRIDAELNAGPDGSGVAVAVFDTGIDLTHPDLAGAIIGSFDATGGGNPTDRNGHGTHVAGTVGARDNGIGYVGVAPSCSLVAVKVLGNSGTGSISWIVAGIDWAVANQNSFSAPIKVGNMSLSAFGTSQALAEAITAATNAGIVFAVSSGNNGANAGNYIPANYGNVICVSALDPDNTWASYSNYGGVVDIIAPGTNVPSLWRGGGYKTISGTSMASPHVAGALALWFDSNSGDFAAALSALQSAGSSSWTGDPADGFHEPLLIASGL